MDTLFIISKQTIWQLSAKGVTSLSTLAVLSLVSRNFGAEGTGVFTLSLTFLSFFYITVDFGLNGHLLTKLTQKNINQEFSSLLGLRLILSLVLIIFAVVVLLAWPEVPEVFKLSALLGLGTIIAYAIYTTSSLLFQYKLSYHSAAISISLGAVSTLFIVAAVGLFKLPPPFLLLGHMAGWYISALISLFLLRKVVTIMPSFDFSYIKRVIKESWPISVTLLINVLYFRTDSFILSYYKGFADVGLYNLAYQIFQSLIVLPTFIMNSLYPVLLSSYQIDRANFSKLFIRSLVILLGLGGLGTFGTLLFSPFVISLISGGGLFAGSVISLKILSLGLPAFFASALLMWVMVIQNKYKTLVLLYGGGLVLSVVLNLILVPYFSFLASSWITVVLEYLILSFQIIILRPTLDIKHE